MSRKPADAASLVFSALADPTRRALLRALDDGERSVSELAADFPISVPAISRHLSVLERSGLLIREKRGRITYCRPVRSGLDPASRWVRETQAAWDGRLDRLDAFLSESGESC